MAGGWKSFVSFELDGSFGIWEVDHLCILARSAWELGLGGGDGGLTVACPLNRQFRGRK